MKEDTRLWYRHMWITTWHTTRRFVRLDLPSVRSQSTWCKPWYLSQPPHWSHTKIRMRWSTLNCGIQCKCRPTDNDGRALPRILRTEHSGMILEALRTSTYHSNLVCCASFSFHYFHHLLCFVCGNETCWGCNTWQLHLLFPYSPWCTKVLALTGIQRSTLLHCLLCTFLCSQFRYLSR